MTELQFAVQIISKIIKVNWSKRIINRRKWIKNKKFKWTDRISLLDNGTSGIRRTLKFSKKHIQRIE